MQRYVLGFMFDKKAEKVALIQKIKPKWQEGLHNGIGGKIEDYDLNSHAAMVREFLEETGVLAQTWYSLLTMQEKDVFSVDVYYTFSDCVDMVRTMENEVVKVFDLKEDWEFLRSKSISNVPWLIMACLDADSESGRLKMTAEYQ